MRESRALSALLELREGEKGTRIAAGDAVIFNSESEPIGYGGFREQFASGAFDDHMAKKPDILILAHHDIRNILGRISANTLRVNIDSKRVAFENDIPNTTCGNDIVESLRRRDIKGMSFGFDCSKDRWDVRDGEVHRTVLKAELFELSYTPDPAYPQTEVNIRSKEYYDKQVAEVKGSQGKRLFKLWYWRSKMLARSTCQK
jgi:HK97 family phage prohead protease